MLRVAMQEGRVTTVVQAESPVTLELLERQAPELQAALRQAGIESGSLSLELASGEQRENWQQDWQQRQQGQATRESVAVERDAAPLPTARENKKQSDAEDGVDTYA